MAEAGLKVMLVDMDTQASLTGLVMYQNFVKMGKEALASEGEGTLPQKQ